MPQLGWSFYDPFFAALVFSFAPRSEGRANNLSMGVGAIFGAAFPVSKRVSLSAAVEVPWTFYRHQMIGLIALAGVSIRL